jgi:predicted O-methyltransferase YrrM
MRDIDHVSRIAASVEGWLSDLQGRALYDAAAATSGRGAIVEIGSWKGRSTVWLARGARLAGRTVHAVDPHLNSREDPGASTLEAFRANIARAGIAPEVRTLVMTSAEAERVVQGPVELLFIDGDHSVDGARSDADLWLPRVMRGGTVMFHDVATSGYSGPRRIFQRRICWNAEFHRVRNVGSMFIAERTLRRSRGEAIHGTASGIFLYFYDVQGAIKRALRRVRRSLGLYPPAVSSA